MYMSEKVRSVKRRCKMRIGEEENEAQAGRIWRRTASRSSAIWPCTLTARRRPATTPTLHFRPPALHRHRSQPLRAASCSQTAYAVHQLDDIVPAQLHCSDSHAHDQRSEWLNRDLFIESSSSVLCTF